MPNIGPTELIIVLVVVLVVFGPKRLPGLGRSLGQGMKEFKDSIGGNRDDEDDEGIPQAIEARKDAQDVGKAESTPAAEAQPAPSEDSPETRV